MTTRKITALRSLCPKAQFAVVGNKDVTWHDMKGDTVPTDSEVEAEIVRLDAVYDNEKYKRDRAAEYPSVVDQLDDIYHNGIDAWKATIKTTKDKYPKP